MKVTKIATSGDIKTLETMMKKYLYSDNVYIENFRVFNSKGATSFFVIKKGKRFYCVSESLFGDMEI